MSESITPYQARPIIPGTDDGDLFRIATAMQQSGYFKDTKDVAQAVVKILAGRELGLGAFTSMSNIIIVNGKLSLSANLIAALVKASRRYDFRVTEHTDTVCRLEFYQDGERVGESSFSIEQAKQAGLMGNAVWKSYPRNMLFARAMSNGAKWFCADVFATGIYMPEELGADVEVEPNGTLYGGGMGSKSVDEMHADATARTSMAGTARDGAAVRESIVNDPLGDGSGPVAPAAINGAQLKRLMAIATANKWTDDEIKLLIANPNYGGYASRKDITNEHYQLICDKALVDAKLHAKVAGTLAAMTEQPLLEEELEAQLQCEADLTGTDMHGA